MIKTTGIINPDIEILNAPNPIPKISPLIENYAVLMLR